LAVVGPPPADLVVTLYRFTAELSLMIEFVDGKIILYSQELRPLPWSQMSPLQDALGKEIVFQHPAIKTDS
jgi:hypothetical protein